MFGLLILLAIGYYFWNKNGGSFDFGARERPERQKALEILEERYARGEINAEEFQERKRNLSK